MPPEPTVVPDDAFRVGPDLYRCENCDGLRHAEPIPHFIASWDGNFLQWKSVAKRVCLWCCSAGGEGACPACHDESAEV